MNRWIHSTYLRLSHSPDYCGQPSLLRTGSDFNLSVPSTPRRAGTQSVFNESVFKECRSKWHSWQRKQDMKKHRGVVRGKRHRTPHSWRGTEHPIFTVPSACVHTHAEFLGTGEAADFQLITSLQRTLSAHRAQLCVKCENYPHFTPIP